MPQTELEANVGAPGSGRARLQVVTLSSVFPNSREPEHGAFIRSRMQAVGARADVTVVAPLPALDYSNPEGNWLASRGIGAQRRDGRLEVWHPRWWFPPFGTVLNPACLFTCVAGPLRRRLRQGQAIDLIDAHFAFPDGIAAALLGAFLKRPFVVTLRGNEPVFGAAAGRRRAMAWALKRASGILAVSEELRRYAIALGADPERCRTVPNGIDADFFSPRDMAAAKAKFGIAAGAKTIVSAGRLVEAKGHHVAVQALGQLRQRGLDAHLLIAGGPCREDRFDKVLHRMAGDLGLAGQVHFLGRVPREAMPELYSCADVVCLASFAEGCPNVVLEAQACGAPVVATRVGAVPEMIQPEETGYVVAARDAQELAAALERSLGRAWDRRAISERGRSRSWERVADEVLGEMERAVERWRDAHVRH